MNRWPPWLDAWVVRRDEANDAVWERIAPLLLFSAGRGGRWKDHRWVPNAIKLKPCTGALWRDFRSKRVVETAHERLRRWSADGARGRGGRRWPTRQIEVLGGSSPVPQRAAGARSRTADIACPRESTSRKHVARAGPGRLRRSTQTVTDTPPDHDES